MTSKLYITEYAQVAVDSLNRSVLCGQEPPLAEQVVDYSAGAAASTAFNADTRFVRIHTDSICSVLFGTAPTATTSTGRMVAGQTEFRGVDPTKGSPAQGALKVSAITNT